MAELRFEKGYLKGKTIQIPAGRYLVVGRAKEAGLPLPDPQLSRRHCKLTHTVEGIMLEDLGSRNGTYVNGQPVTTVKLRHGDQVQFGDQAATYNHPKGLMDSSGDYESEEVEATREIPELQPGQAMLLNPPKIVRGPDSAPPPKPPTQIGAPQGAGTPPPVIEPGLLPPSQALDADIGDELPQIDQAMPLPAGLDDQIDADLSAPLPDLPPNPISMEETMVKPKPVATDPAKAPLPKSKIKKLMESYKAEVMASTIDEVKPVPKAKPATSLKQSDDSGEAVVAQGALTPVEAGEMADAESAADAEEADAPALRPMTAPAPRRGTAEQRPLPPATVPSPPRPPVYDEEAQIEAVLEAADEQMRPTAAESKPAPHPKTIPLRPDPTPEEEAQAAKRASQMADSFAEELLDRELSEEPEVIDEEAEDDDGPFEAEDTEPERTRELKADETGEIDPAEIQGAGGSIDIDTSRIDRHREIADEIFRAAQSEETAEPEAEAAAEEEVIEEVGEDFDLESLEQVAAPTLDLGKLDSTEKTAESATGIEVLSEDTPAQKPAPAAQSRTASGGTVTKPAAASRKMTPPPSMPPIAVEEHLEEAGPEEQYPDCAGLWEPAKPRSKPPEGNLLGPILAKNEEYQRVSE